MQAEGVHVQFDGLVALDAVDLEVRPGEVLGLIGPNGSGKTTMVNVLSGFVRPLQGIVRAGNREITRLAPESRARLGIVRTFQGVRSFGALSVRENVETAALLPGGRRRVARRRADDLLARFRLSGRAEMPARSLTSGEERLLALARAVAMEPVFLMLDEPGAGLNDEESDALLDAIQRLRSPGLGLLVVDHDMRLIMRLCDRVQVLDRGRTIRVGTPEQVQTDTKVIDAYLGVTHDQEPGDAED